MALPIRATPVTRGIKRLFWGRGILESVAYRQEILCPEEGAIRRPAIFLPGQLERVTGTGSYSTKEGQIAAATSPTATHASTIAYHIKNAVLFDGSIYAGRLKHFVADKSLFNSPTSGPRHIKTVGLASSFMGTRFFAHWLIDDCIQYLLAEESGQPLCLRGPTYREGHQQKYQNYFDQDWTPVDRAWIDHLIVYQDFAQNSLKGARYRLLRERVRARFPSGGSRLLVYLRRGTTGVRRVIQDENEIIDVLTQRGFVVVDIERDSLEHLLDILASAKIVISIEGSHAGHCAFSVPENSAFLVLQPPDRFSGWHRGWMDSVGVRFGFVVGALGDRGYCFDCSEILRTLDLMLKSLDVTLA